MFYPSPDDCETIEDEFIKPVIRSLRDINSLTAMPTNYAFCCSMSIDQLKSADKTGALEWINKFKNMRNTKGQPLPAVLARHGMFWYQMDTKTLADFILSMNPDTRIFIAKTPEPTFVDQRIIRFTIGEGIDHNLIHALLNSTFSMYFIEALGFGRGLGVLDINATKIRKGFYVPDISLINERETEKILSAFSNIKNRPVKSVFEELEDSSRRNLDQKIAKAIGLPMSIVDDVHKALLTLYRIRKSVNH